MSASPKKLKSDQPVPSDMWRHRLMQDIRQRAEEDSQQQIYFRLKRFMWTFSSAACFLIAILCSIIAFNYQVKEDQGDPIIEDIASIYSITPWYEYYSEVSK